jgi:hypothetical protein
MTEDAGHFGADPYARCPGALRADAIISVPARWCWRPAAQQEARLQASAPVVTRTDDVIETSDRP